MCLSAAGAWIMADDYSDVAHRDLNAIIYINIKQ